MLVGMFSMFSDQRGNRENASNCLERGANVFSTQKCQFHLNRGISLQLEKDGCLEKDDCLCTALFIQCFQNLHHGMYFIVLETLQRKTKCTGSIHDMMRLVPISI